MIVSLLIRLVGSTEALSRYLEDMRSFMPIRCRLGEHLIWLGGFHVLELIRALTHSIYHITLTKLNNPSKAAVKL